MDQIEVSVKVESNVSAESEEMAISAKELPDRQAIGVNGKTMFVEEEIEEVFQVTTEIVSIKEEPNWEDTEWGPNHAAQSELYAGHEVKQEMVIGKEALQPADAAFKIVTPSVERTYKQEVEESDGEKAGTEVELLIGRTSQKQLKSSANKKRVTSEEVKYVCDNCNDTFSIKKRLISHMRFHVRRKGFYCAICDKVIHRRNEQVHQRIHKREYRCKHCQKQLVSLNGLIIHERIHTGEKPYQCNICTKRFVCSSSLDKHKRTHSLLKKHACKVCEKRFKELSQLRIHELIHKGESAKRFYCQYCEMKFAQRYKLVVHERSHTGVTPYACRICNKKYTQKFLLDAHIRVHTGETPYTCGTCNKGFRLNDDLRTHLRIHSGVKPFPCDLCGKCFTQRAHLVSHKLVHTGEKPLLCIMCDKRFACKRYLVKHIQRIYVAEKRIHSCDQCGKQFGGACYLTLHSKSHLDQAR